MILLLFLEIINFFVGISKCSNARHIKWKYSGTRAVDSFLVTSLVFTPHGMTFVIISLLFTIVAVPLHVSYSAF